MSTHLDLDDVCAGHPLAQEELTRLHEKVGTLMREANKAEAELRRLRIERDALRSLDDSLLTEFNKLHVECDALRAALQALLARDKQQTCQHETTFRGGVIWEICEDCGARWADDEGGKPKWTDPPEWIAARAALNKEVKP